VSARKSRADWRWAKHHLHYADETVEVIVINDMNLGNMSVTNDIEAVLEELATDLPRSLADYPVMYFDSSSKLDEILINEKGEFAGFADLPRNLTGAAAMREAAARWAHRLTQRAQE